MTDLATLRPIEKRILGYLDQRGETHRENIVCDLASPTSRIGRGILKGSNSGIPRLMGAWAKRLIEKRLITRTKRWGHFAITSAGRRALRDSAHADRHGQKAQSQ